MLKAPHHFFACLSLLLSTLVLHQQGFKVGISCVDLGDQFSLGLVFGFVNEHSNHGFWDDVVKVLPNHIKVGGYEILDDRDFHLRSGGALRKFLHIWVADLIHIPQRHGHVG